MKNIPSCLIYALLIQLLSANSSGAQSKSEQPILKTQAISITIDGDLKDWGDSLHYYNQDNNVRYSFASDKEYLFFAVRIDDRSEALRILKASITLSIDPKGKKKNAYSVTFPLSNVPSNPPSLTPKPDNFNEITQADRDELARETITTLRGIKVEGFKDIDGDMITTSNSYGIKTAINYDEKGNLVCEAAIAFKLLHIDDQSKNDWLFDVKINGVVRQPLNKPGEADNGTGSSSRGGIGGGGRGGMGGGGRGGMGGGGGRGGNRATTLTPDSGVLGKSIEFSGKLELVTRQ